MPSNDELLALDAFLDASAQRPMLGLMYGRRRIGKSTLLVQTVRHRGGFYYEAARVDTGMQLRRLGASLGSYLDVGPLALEGWEDAIDRLLGLADTTPFPVVLDEFGYMLEADPSVASLIAGALGPVHGRTGAARLVLCGSAITLMRSLTAGQAPLRGRAGMELLMWPDDYRRAASRLAVTSDLDLAGRVFSVIGGVVGYATDMVAHDLPEDADDFGRWVAQRVLSPAATLHHEATTLLAEDPTLAAGSRVHHHSILAAIGGGSGTAGAIAKRVGRPVPNLAPALNRLVDTGFVARHEDPIRGRRPTYRLIDPFLQFNYAVLEPHRSLLRAHGADALWSDRLVHVFDSQVRGPVFEQQARAFVQRYADAATLGGPADHVGPSEIVADGVAHEVDVVVATGDDVAASRTVLAIGEAKVGQTVDAAELRRLERLRAALGTRGAHARLLLFAARFTNELRQAARARSDLELVDHDRLYHGT